MAEGKNDKITELLEELLKWVRFENTQKARDTLIGLLKTDLEKLVYENSDGRTTREIAHAVGTSHVTVINYWKKWVGYGVVKEKSSRGGTRFVKVFSLSDFGIEVPRTSTEKRTPLEPETKETIDEKSSVEVQK